VSTLSGALLLAGRVLFAALFASSARGHIQSHSRYRQTAGGKLPLPGMAGWPAGAYLLLADLSIVAGIWPDLGSLMIAVFLIPAMALFHPWWRFPDPAVRRTQQSSFFRNVSLLGAALCLFAFFTTAGHVAFAVTGPAISLR
jgi:putative oxidoreductase